MLVAHGCAFPLTAAISASLSLSLSLSLCNPCHYVLKQKTGDAASVDFKNVVAKCQPMGLSSYAVDMELGSELYKAVFVRDGDSLHLFGQVSYSLK